MPTAAVRALSFVKRRRRAAKQDGAQALAAGCWPGPEYPYNVNTSELGNLGLTPAEESAIVAFLKALSDGYLP